jgi:allantoate deiminase
VATVGRMEVAPGAVNVIPSSARFTLDVRSPEDVVRRDAVALLECEFREIAQRRGIAAQLRKSYEEAATACAGWLTGQLEAAAARLGIRPLRLPSGAGHDGLAMAALCPIAMLFVRCKGGISHNPAESITPEDADVAVRVLVDFLRHLQPQPH